VIVVNDHHHLRGTLQEYVSYYNAQRTHLGIGKDSPDPWEVQAEGEFDKVAVVGGLHQYYYRRTA
jgi:non-ribosomal peptide synthetase component F